MRLAVSAAMVFARDGLLAANARDGTSRLLEWLGPAHELVRTMPSAIAARDTPGSFYASVAVWVGLVVSASWVARHWRLKTPGVAGAGAGLIVVMVVTVASLVVPVFSAARASTLATRADAPLLQEYDARQRPVAIVYDPLRMVEPERVPRNAEGIAAAGPLSVVALICGWVTTEVGRQPWVVYRVMRTSEAVTGAGGIPVGYATLVVVYLALACAVARILLRLARAPLDVLEAHGAR